jgi:S-(hydroxymethyl)glutathione dehydrogenase/alcohol dehydrogenase
MVQDPGPNEVLIRLSAAGLCHSDLYFIEGDGPHTRPVVFGHEGIGIVLKNGAGVKAVQEGDTVIPYLVPDCGECVYCKSGMTNHCVQMGRSFAPGYKTWFSRGDTHIQSFMGLGTFSEYVVVPEDQVQKVPSTLPADQACCVGCGVTTGVGGALISAAVRPGSAVVVYGLGGVGLSAIQGARIAGAKMIIGVDLNPDKASIAEAHGATHFINGREQNAVAEVMKLTGIGADYAFDCVGHPKLFEQGLACLNRGWGKMISIGIIPDAVPVPVKWSDLSGKSWQRSFMGGAKRQDMARYAEWLDEGKLDLKTLVSHRIAIEDINYGFDLMREGKATRTVILYR